jgi:hypothetical protein
VRRRPMARRVETPRGPLTLTLAKGRTASGRATSTCAEPRSPGSSPAGPASSPSSGATSPSPSCPRPRSLCRG